MIRQFASLAGQLARGRTLGLLIAGVGLAATACFKKEAKPRQSEIKLDPSRLDRFVKTMLDRNGDGKFDPSELSPVQLAHLIEGQRPEVPADVGKAAELNKELSIRFDTATPSDLIAAIRRHGQSPEEQAKFIAKVFQNYKDSDAEPFPTGTYLSLSGYQASHWGRGLGLIFNDCMIEPVGFQESLVAYLNLRGVKDHRPVFTADEPLSPQVRDPLSFSNFPTVTTTHVDLDLTLDFDKKEIEGTATLTLGKQGENRIVLDAADMVITGAEVILKGPDKKPIPVRPSPGPVKEGVGQGITLELPPEVEKVVVHYKTQFNPRAKGVTWYDADLSYSGKWPFMYTQGAPHYYQRWLFPHQNTPAARVTLSAKIRVRQELGVRVVMSSTIPHGGMPQISQREGKYKVWSFVIDKPVPTYVIGLAAGELTATPKGSDSILYTEPHLSAEASNEFRDFSHYVQHIESRLGPSPFPVTDTLIPPPSFPWGGMENLGVNFDSNTIIAGDRSEMWIAIHEFLHNYYGNSVSHTRIEDAWLIEAPTTYMQNVAGEELFGSDAAIAAAFNYRGSLDAKLNAPGESHQTCLATRINYADPDDMINSFYYAKPFHFMKWLEGQVGGREKMIALLRRYVAELGYSNITSREFADFITRNASVDRTTLHEWLYGPGAPQDLPEFDSKPMQEAKEMAQRWGSGETHDFKIPGAESWIPAKWDYFLEQLYQQPKLPREAMESLSQHGLDGRQNSEVRAAWYALVAKHRYEPAYPGLRRFFDGRIGRAKFVRQVFVGFAQGGDMKVGIEVYEGLRRKLHPITRGSVDRLMGYKPKEKG